MLKEIVKANRMLKASSHSYEVNYKATCEYSIDVIRAFDPTDDFPPAYRVDMNFYSKDLAQAFAFAIGGKVKRSELLDRGIIGVLPIYEDLKGNLEDLLGINDFIKVLKQFYRDAGIVWHFKSINDDSDTIIEVKGTHVIIEGSVFPAGRSWEEFITDYNNQA